MLLNQVTLRQIMGEMGDDAQLLLETAHESLQDYLRMLRERDENTSREDLTRYVHSMKSTFASLGGEEAYRIAANYEADLRNDQAVDLDELGNQLEAAFHELFEAIKQALGTLD